MDKKIQLTVAIPTYNRSSSLEKILLQLQKEKNQKFLILISDDNSSDKTALLVNKYQKLMENLVYHKNKKNLGFSGNVCKLYELVKTQYIWYLCDDDTVIPGAIDNIVQAVNKYKPVVALFNCRWVNSYGQELMSGVKKNKTYTSIRGFNDYNGLMRLGYLSINVFEKKYSINELKKTKFNENVFFQITLALFLLSKEFRFVQVAKTVVHRNVGYKYGDFFKFNTIDSLKAVTIIPHDFDNNKFIRWSKSHVFESLQLYLSQKLGLFQFDLKPTKDTKQKIIANYGLFYGYFLLSFPTIKRMTPTFFLKAVYLMRLTKIHGLQKAKQIYKDNINRAYTDTRKTRFTTYR